MVNLLILLILIVVVFGLFRLMERKGTAPAQEIAKEGSTPVSATSQDAVAQIMNSNSETNDYGTSIGVATFISFLGWIAVIAGAGITIWLVEKGAELFLLLPSIAISLVGLLLVIGGQASRAVMDNANYSKAMLEIMKKNA